ncbi:MAG: decarboxylating 6-phosphogluconate dehydrogenase [Candidatus Levybacteria bacterium]|nr:decarboxylating 6-phosphogluconate dehydrogenase [Candidatus Levybacteria bacterium]
MKFGFIGLGKMGSRMVGKLLQEGHEVVAWNRSDNELKNTETVEELVKSLGKPRIVWSMVPAGEATEDILDEVLKFIEKGDIVIDGGNSHFKDTQRRFDNFKKKGIRFLGIGVSGGIIAAKEGYPMMVGGDKSAYELIKPILSSLAKPHGGHEYFGIGGAGHFVKMLHNGIEYGIMQSLGEGFEVLEKAPYKLDLLKVAKLWQKGTLVSGFMLDRTVEVFAKDPTLSDIQGIIAESGEARWTIDQAKEEGVRVEIIERSLDYRKRSQRDKKIQNSFTAKLVAALRNAFGGHKVKKI